jgi:AraC-like DNA-binding protein
MLVRSQSVGPLLALVARSGKDPQPLVAQFALPPEATSDVDFALSIDALAGLFDAAAALLDEPFVGVKTALSLARGRYGLLEYATFNAATLQQSLQILVRYSALINRAVKYELELGPTEGRILQHIDGRPDGLGRHGNEFNVVAMLQMGRAILKRMWAPSRVWFTHPRPARTDVLESALGTSEVVFGASFNGFTVSRALLDERVSTADARLLQLLERYADQELAALPADESFASRVQQTLTQQWRPGQAPSLDELSAQLKMSPRTLQRRLKAEHLDYQTALDRVREQMARRLLAAKPQLGELAFVLGYADLGSFIRAFKRWTGTTPGQFVRDPRT